MKKEGWELFRVCATPTFVISMIISRLFVMSTAQNSTIAATLGVFPPSVI